ncbi:MAG: prephenate dehydrogenase/arogenate dehydrogenase family protein [Gammaproteobacteria bacterium]|jgi:chorismate mutase/prephenate dehydrogenase|nr:prephenate dehydrogenase/arogenate dehydrogenase family protein [Gammaproteobacteria bacterium]MDH3752106.1 prephenate dehydrogenase/arogenate dehydrogenase family protein [Gammaproteobacteria bacterium]MDH3806065.1 prephenate dehydrogenase/arogenate dehydrogenase family protein [Gammaproteobacteria bacterium]
MSLDDLRNDLSAVDRQLVDLIAERQRLVSEIGLNKLSSGTGTRDYAREKDVLDMGRAQAVELGIDPDLAEDVLRKLIRSSLASQERDRVIAEGKGDGRRVLVIGGAGKMGGWFVDFFASQGYATTVADPGVEDGPGRFSNWTDAGVDYDVIVVAAPLAVSGRILAQLAVLKPQGLIFDIGSLKTPLIDGLQELQQAGCRVASLHPMYGPDTRLLSGHHLIFCDVGSKEATADAKELFSSTMVEQIDMGLDDHDRLIAYVLGLSHALNIAFFTALADSGEAAPKLAQMSSTTFDSQLLVSAAVAQDNPHLYFEIQHLNKFGLGPLDALCEASGRIRAVVAGGDEDGFVELMKKGKEYMALRG